MALAIMSDTQKQKYIELIGLAVIRLQNDKDLDANDRQGINELIGMLSFQMHESAIAEKLAAQARAISILQSEVATLQRQGAVLS